MKQLADIKVGDTVVTTDSKVTGSPRNGTSGTVMCVLDGTVEVDFPGWGKGHYGNTRDRSITTRYYFFAGDDNPGIAKAKPTLADELTLKPSTRTILAHLKSKGSITVMEALAAYGMTRIAPQIFELREFGIGIDTVSKKDAAGHKYTRYAMKAPHSGAKKAA